MAAHNMQAIGPWLAALTAGIAYRGVLCGSHEFGSTYPSFVYDYGEVDRPTTTRLSCRFALQEGVADGSGATA